MALGEVRSPGAMRAFALSGPIAWVAARRRPLAEPAAEPSPEAAATAGDMGASGLDKFEPFVRLHERPILNYLWRMTGDEQAALDLTQEVFVRAWRHYVTISGYERPRGWLFRVATNLALTHNTARRRRDAATTPLFEGDRSPATSDVARRVAERDLVRETLLQLPAKRRAALVLREVYGLSVAEVAAALGTTEAAVRMALCRARERFREIYAREGERR